MDLKFEIKDNQILRKNYLRYDVFNSNSSHLDYLIIDYDIPLAPI